MSKIESSYKPLSDGKVNKITEKYYEREALSSQKMSQPIALFIAGQSGAGKTAISEKERRNIDGGYVLVDADRMREEIPNSSVFPSNVTQGDAGKLVGALRDLILADKRNFVEEGTFRNPDSVDNSISSLKANGYRVEMIAVAVNFEQSLLGIYLRYEMQIEKKSAFPRLVPEDYHKIAFDGFTETIKTHADKFDRLRIVNREGNVLFDSAGGDSLKDAFTALTQGREMKQADFEILKNGWNKVSEMAAKRGEKDEAYLTRLAVNRKRSESLYREELYKPNQHVQKNQEQHQSQNQVQTAKVKNRLR